MALFAVPDPPASLAEFLLAHVRSFTRHELASVFSQSALRTAVATGSAQRLVPGVYAATVHAQSFTVRAHAVVTWSGAPISGTSALFVWGLLDAPPSAVEITVPHESRVRGPHWLKVRRASHEIPTTERNGVRVVSPAHAIVSGFGYVDPRLRGDVVFRAVRTGLVGVPQVRKVLRETPKVRARRALIARLDAVERGAHSWLEERGLRSVFNTREFAAFVRQHEVVVEGERFVLDMFDRSARLAVELDGDRFHGDREARLRDIRRDALVATKGIQTIRLSTWDLVNRPDWCRMVVREALRARRSAS